MLNRLLDKLKFTERNLPLAIFVTGILAFGLQIPSLGFFQDDWHFVHYGSAAGARGMLDFLTMDGRPTAAWVYATLYPLLGFSPLPWHVLSLTLRLVTVLLVWSTLRTLWPERARTNLMTAFFFLLYPFFTLQPQAVVYAEHWTSYALFFASLLLMMRAIQNPKRWLIYTALAILAETLHLFTVEYFVGLELLRPLVAWMMLSNVVRSGTPQSPAGYHPAPQIKRVALTWLPYFIILLLFLYWRTVFLGSLDLRNNPADALSLSSIVTSLQNLPADISLVLVSSWFKLIDPAALELTRARNFFFLALTLLGGLAAYFYSRSFSEDTTSHATRNTPQLPITNYQLPRSSHLLFALLAFILGLAPAYAANFILHTKLEPWNGRFALAAMPGAAMILAVAFERLVTSPQARRVAFAVLVGLLIGFHNRVAFDFKNAWEKQVTLYEQLTWRAPYIEPGTAIITDQEILGYMGDYPTSFALNTIYDTKSLRPSPYWFFAMSENIGTDPASLIEGMSLEAQKYASTFVGNSKDSLIIDFEPEKNQCLWILRPEDAAYRPLVAQLKAAAPVSNLSRIQDKHDTIPTLFETIVPQDQGTWCFHYQRADLARQLGDWEQVIFFWDLAQNGGYTPGHGFEYIPFIQAYAHTGNWNQAFALTKQSNRTSESMRTILCPMWEELTKSTSPSPERESAFSDAKNLLGCQ
jgi:hypothetical protein